MITWNELAEAEFKEAFNWYEGQRIGLGHSLVICIDACLDNLNRHPFYGTPIHVDVRRVLIKKFPYGLYYRVIKSDIEIIGFRHFRRETINLSKRISPTR
jgi:plasmid stabilization system protein ParE